MFQMSMKVQVNKFIVHCIISFNFYNHAANELSYLDVNDDIHDDDNGIDDDVTGD